MKLIIFDIDGTLTNTKAVDDKCFINAFDTIFGVDLTEEDWGALKHVTDWGMTEEIILREYNRLPTPTEYQQMLERHVNNLKEAKAKDPSQFQAIKGAVAFFNHIRLQTNWQVGIATGAWEQSALLKLNAIGISTNGIAFSNSDYHKSREAITQHTIEQMSKQTTNGVEEIIYFGDGVWDYKTCQNLGITFIGIDVYNDDKLRSIGATQVFRDYTQPEQIMEVLMDRSY